MLPSYSIQQPSSYLQCWFVNGNIHCFIGWHIPLALLAIAVLIVTVFFLPLIYIISMKRRLIKVRLYISYHQTQECYIFILIGITASVIIQGLYWLKYFEEPLTECYKEKWKWWSAVELARRFLFILFIIPFPRNFVS